MTTIIFMIYNSYSVVYILHKRQNYGIKGDDMSFSALKSCSERIENYLKYQPGYPKKLLNFLYEDVGLSRESVIADICSGAGVLTRLLLERGSRVVAIESDDQMREIAERLLGDEFLRFVSLKGTAENTTLFNEAVNFIVCTQSLRQFRIDKCRKEFLRIMKPSGTIVFLYNRLNQEDDFIKEYRRLIEQYQICHETSDYRELSEDEIADFFNSTSYNHVSFTNRQNLDYEGVRARFLSEGNSPKQWDNGYEEMLDEFHNIFEQYNQNRKVLINYTTEVYIGEFRK